MNARERRFIVRGTIVIVVALAGKGAIHWKHAWHESHARLEQARGLYAAAQVALDASNGTMAGAMGATGIDSLLLDGANAAPALASLSETVSAWADSASTRVLTLAPELDSVSTGELHRVSLRAHIGGDLEGVRMFLAATTDVRPAIGIAELVLRAPDFSYAGDAGEAFQLELLLRGWYRERAR